MKEAVGPVCERVLDVRCSDWRPSLQLLLQLLCLALTSKHSVQPHSALDSIAMLDAADAAMYRAKSGVQARYAVAYLCDRNIADEPPRTQPAEL